ncbi:VanW family protein [Rhodococcus sp. NPDC054953]
MTGGIGKHSGAERGSGLPDGETPDSVHPDGDVPGPPLPSDGEPTAEPSADPRDARGSGDATGPADVDPEPPTEHIRPEDVPTTVLPKMTPGASPGAATPPPVQPAATPVAVPPPPPATTPPSSTSPQAPPTSAAAPDPDTDTRRRRRLVIGAAAGVLAVGVAGYIADVALSSDQVPRGVTVAGVDIGGMSPDEAESVLRTELDPRLGSPVVVRAGDVATELVPAEAGLGVDWDATLDRAGDQPLNPITRLASLFTHREVGVAATRDDGALAAAVEGLRTRTDRAPVEGSVVFEGATPVAVSPRQGQTLDAPGAAEALADGWAAADGVEVPVTVDPVSVTQSGVDRALREIATPAAATDLVVAGRDGGQAVLPRDRIGSVLSFTPDGDGGLSPHFDVDAAIGVLGPQLAATEIQPKDASFTLSGGAPKVVPAVTGETIEWHKTLESLPAGFSDAGRGSLDAVYEPKQPALTTEAANKLGITEVIAEYTTGGFEYASGVNIRLAAAEIDGALVQPGKTFSLNDYTGPRGSAEGYVSSGIINNGRPDTAVGGGISQLATTLYNAAYFAGMEDAGHTEHSYYISRYPEAREATVYEGAIDLRFTNDTDTGVLIETIGTSSDITVRLWGTKTVDVESITGDRYAYTSPNTVTLPAGSGCIASSGAQGFTTSDTRVITDRASGRELSRNTRTVKYDPVPIVRCISPEPPPAPADAAAPAAPPASAEDAPSASAGEAEGE